jgi:hypothetical protein
MQCGQQFLPGLAGVGTGPDQAGLILARHFDRIQESNKDTREE